MATLTMIGLFNYNNDLFSKLSLPDGVDRETVINEILTDSADFEVLFPDADFMRDEIGLVSSKYARTFQKWYDALQLEYEPIENYDRHEEWTDEGTDTGSVNGHGVSNSQETNTASAKTAQGVSAYDATGYSPDTSADSSQSATSKASGVDTSETQHNTKTSGKHTGHVHGNIGVTTSQQMLESELQLDAWNLYQHIADVFVTELTIPVY